MPPPRTARGNWVLRYFNFEGIPKALSIPKSHRKDAFTLAEVLITLGIIGIVAAMTMPSLIANYQKKQTVSQLKKAYSEISQAVKLAETQHGFMDEWDFSCDGSSWREQNEIFMNEYLAPNLKLIKSCIPVTTECWNEGKSINGNKFTDLSTVYWNTFTSAISASGYSIYAWTSEDNHAYIWVDLNGPAKGPSIMGKDIFGFRVLFADKKVYMVGLHYKDKDIKRDDLAKPSWNEWSCTRANTAETAGGGCGALIQMDGWEIKDDYPW